MNTREWLGTVTDRLGDGFHKARVQAWIDAADAHAQEKAWAEGDAQESRRACDLDMAESDDLLALQCATRELECLAQAMNAVAENRGADSVVIMNGKEVLVIHGILTHDSAERMNDNGILFVEAEDLSRT